MSIFPPPDSIIFILFISSRLPTLSSCSEFVLYLDNDVTCSFIFVSSSNSLTVWVYETLLTYLSNTVTFVDFIFVCSTPFLDTELVFSYHYFNISLHSPPGFPVTYFLFCSHITQNRFCLFFIAWNYNIYFSWNQTGFDLLIWSIWILIFLWQLCMWLNFIHLYISITK